MRRIGCVDRIAELDLKLMLNRKESTELEKFEAQEATVLVVGGSVDPTTELEHFFPQMKLMIIDFLPRCLGSLSDGTADSRSEYMPVSRKD